MTSVMAFEDGSPTTEKSALERVLDMKLTKKQINHIKTEWRAFYNNPLYYKKSVVVDMVKLSLEDVKNDL